MTFQLDISGSVWVGLTASQNFTPVLWSDLSPFVQGCIEAMFQTLGACPGVEHGGHRAPPDAYVGGVFPCARCGVPIDVTGGRNKAALSFSDLAPETLARVIEDSDRWLAGFPGRNPHHDLPASGRLFWEIRQAGKRESFPPLALYLRDDGKVHHREVQS